MSHASRKKSMGPAGWIALAGVSAVAVIAAALMISEAHVHSQCDASLQALGEAIGKKKVTRKQVPGYLQGDPTRRVNKKKNTETYTWDGVFGSYGMRVEFDSWDDVTRVGPL